MSAKINSGEIVYMRNKMPIQTVLHALMIPWKKDDQLLRFACPVCKGMHTSLHPSENLGRCFDCNKNFNPIDLVCAQKKDKFRSAIFWLRLLKREMEDDDFSRIIEGLKRNTILKL